MRKSIRLRPGTTDSARGESGKAMADFARRWADARRSRLSLEAQRAQWDGVGGPKKYPSSLKLRRTGHGFPAWRSLGEAGCLWGSIETGIHFECPYCGSPNGAPLDPVDGVQEWTTDCESCCQPVSVALKVRGGEVLEMDCRMESD